MPHHHTRIELAAHYPGLQPWPCAGLRAGDANGISHVTRAHLAHGADRVTVAYRGEQYDPETWNGYIAGTIKTLTPLNIPALDW